MKTVPMQQYQKSHYGKSETIQHYGTRRVLSNILKLSLTGVEIDYDATGETSCKAANSHWDINWSFLLKRVIGFSRYS